MLVFVEAEAPSGATVISPLRKRWVFGIKTTQAPLGTALSKLHIFYASCTTNIVSPLTGLDFLFDIRVPPLPAFAYPGHQARQATADKYAMG